MYGTFAFLTNGFVSTQAFKIKGQEELSRVCELVNAICPPTSSCTFQMRPPAQLIAACTALSTDEAEYRGTCSHQHNIGCDRCSDSRDAVLDIQVALSHLQLSS